MFFSGGTTFLEVLGSLGTANKRRLVFLLPSHGFSRGSRKHEVLTKTNGIGPMADPKPMDDI